MADYKDIIAGTLNVLAGKVKEAVNTVSESMGENGSVREVYEAGAGRAKAYARMAKLSLELNGEREELKRVYTEIGKLYYDAAKDAPEGFFASLFAQVDEINARIQAKSDEIDEIKAEVVPGDIDVEISEFDDVVSESENDVTGRDRD